MKKKLSIFQKLTRYQTSMKLSDYISMILSYPLRKLFILEEEKRCADHLLIEKFFKTASPAAMQQLSLDIQRGVLLDREIDLIQEISDFYSLPQNRFYFLNLQRKFEQFESAFNALSEFTSLHSTPSTTPGVVLFGNIKTSTPEYNEAFHKLKLLEQALARAYVDFLRHGQKKNFSGRESVVMLLLAALIGVAMLISLLTLLLSSLTFLQQ